MLSPHKINRTLNFLSFSIFIGYSPPNTFFKGLLNQLTIVAKIYLSPSHLVRAFIDYSNSVRGSDEFGDMRVHIRVVDIEGWWQRYFF